MQNWNSKVQFPSDNFILTCVDAAFGPSASSGKPMITLECEIKSPETVTVAGEEYNVAGQKVGKLYYVTTSIDADGNVDIQKTESCKKRVDEQIGRAHV